MSLVHLDTHVALWMFAGLVDRLAPAARHLEGHEILLSPMAFLELQYLHEIGRTTAPASEVVLALAANTGLSLAATPWQAVIRTALALSWTCDPFDRLIGAHALTDDAPLVTADEQLRGRCANAVWS